MCRHSNSSECPSPASTSASATCWRPSTGSAKRPLRTSAPRCPTRRPTRPSAPTCACWRRRGTSSTRRRAAGSCTPRRSSRRPRVGRAVRHLLRTFFVDAPETAFATLLSETASDLSEEKLDQLDALIRDARTRGRMMGAFFLSLAVKGTVVLALGAAVAGSSPPLVGVAPARRLGGDVRRAARGPDPRRYWAVVARGRPSECDPGDVGRPLRAALRRPRARPSVDRSAVPPLREPRVGPVERVGGDARRRRDVAESSVGAGSARRGAGVASGFRARATLGLGVSHRRRTRFGRPGSERRPRRAAWKSRSVCADRRPLSVPVAWGWGARRWCCPRSLRRGTRSVPSPCCSTRWPTCVGAMRGRRGSPRPRSRSTGRTRWRGSPTAGS